MIFYEYKSKHKISESEKILSKYLLPVYQRFSNHKQIFKKYPYLTLDSRIKLCTLKIMKSLEDAELLSKNENSNNWKREKYFDELELEKIDLDYNTIHSEILENIILDENDSGISDLDNKDKEKNKKNIFQIQKMKKFIHKSIKSLLSENEEKESKPLIELKEKENINIENNHIFINNKNNIKINEKNDVFNIKEKILVLIV